jgi:hypothetical protein
MARGGRLLGQGVVHNANIQGLFGVVYHGCHIVGCFVEEALQVGVVNNFVQDLEILVDKKGTRTQEGRGNGDM